MSPAFNLIQIRRLITSSTSEVVPLGMAMIVKLVTFCCTCNIKEWRKSSVVTQQRCNVNNFSVSAIASPEYGSQWVRKAYTINMQIETVGWSINDTSSPKLKFGTFDLVQNIKLYIYSATNCRDKQSDNMVGDSGPLWLFGTQGIKLS